MKPKQHAEVWEAVSRKLNTLVAKSAGSSRRNYLTLEIFADIVAESYRESDDAR